MNEHYILYKMYILTEVIADAWCEEGKKGLNDDKHGFPMNTVS